MHESLYQFLFATVNLSPAISSQFIFRVCAAAEDCKNQLKHLILELRRLSKSSTLIRLKSLSLVLVVIGSMPMVIYKHFHERLTNNSKITTFTGVPLFLCPHAQVSLNIENRDLDCRSLHSMPTILYAASPCLSQLISVQFALELCLSAQNSQKSIKNLYFAI